MHPHLMVTACACLITRRSLGGAAPTMMGSRMRTFRRSKYFPSRTALTLGAALLSAATIAVPASAAAATSPPAATTHVFQIPSLTGTLAPGGACGPGLLGAAAVPAHSSTDPAGTTTFGIQFDPIGLTSTPATGTATLGWFNLSTFQGGLTTFPISALPAPAVGSGGSLATPTGNGEIIAVVLPNLTGAATPCHFTPSIGVFPAP